MFVLVGLGNPGGQYALNRHNIGFMAIDSIAYNFNFPEFKIKYNALISEGKVGNHAVMLVKPVTFMNLSGRSVQQIASFYKIPLNQIFVFHDDLDVIFGKIKVKLGGGHGGHNGLKSLDQSIGKDYWRLRIGIDHPGHKDAVTGHVLSNFTKDEQNDVADILATLCKHIPSLFEEKDINSWHSKLSQDLLT